MIGVRPSRELKSVSAAGQILKVAREERGQGLAEVAEELKMSSKHIGALESGDLSVFKAEVYARGAFVRYAKYLGVYAEKLQQNFLQSVSDVREQVPLTMHTPESWWSRITVARTVMVLVGLALVGAVGSYIGWQVNSFVRLPDLELMSPANTLVRGNIALVKGTAAVDATVVINEEPILLKEGGVFEEEMRLHKGLNIIEVSATNAAGRTTKVTRELLVEE